MLSLLVVVVSVAMVVDVAEHSLRLFLRAARFVHHRIQRPRPDLGSGLQTAPAGCAPRAWPIVHKGIVVTTQRATEGGPAAVDSLHGHIGAVEHRVAGGAVARPRAGVTGWPVGQVATAFCAVAATRAVALVLPAVGCCSSGVWGGGGCVVQSGAGGAALGWTG